MSPEEDHLSEREEHLVDLGEAARRAGSIVTEQINSIVEGAERQADDIRRDAERDADLARREAHESARRVLERISALERPLGDLVMTLRHEMDRLGGEIEGRGPEVTSDAIEAPSTGERALEAPPAPRQEAAPAPAEEAAREQPPPAEAEPQAPEPETRQRPAPAAPPKPEASPARGSEERQEPPEPPARPEGATAGPGPAVREPAGGVPAEPATWAPPTVPGDEEPGRVRGVIDRLTKGRAGGEIFVDTPGRCAVCQRSFAAGSSQALAVSGWQVSGDVGLCPDCQQEGWQLPEGARLPFRRGGG